MHIFSFSFVHFFIRCTYVYTRLLDAAAAVRPWQWWGKQHHGVGKVLAKRRATSETQQSEIDRSVHTSLYHPARLPLCPAHFDVTTNYIVSPKNWSPKKRHSSVCYIWPQKTHTNFQIFLKISLAVMVEIARLDRKTRRAPANGQKYCPLDQNKSLKKVFLIKKNRYIF